MNAAINAVLALIQQILPLISAGAAPGGTVASIVNVLASWLPLIVSEITSLYEPVKNIITSLQSSGQLTQDEITSLQALDKKVDDAFAAATAGLDPDVS